MLGNTLREINVRENPVAQSRIEQLKEALTTLSASVDRLANSRTILTDEAIGQLSRAVTDNLTKMRGCASNVGQIPPDRRVPGRNPGCRRSATVELGQALPPSAAPHRRCRRGIENTRHLPTSRHP